MSVNPVNKIYIDTKFKTNSSTSNSNFKIELPETVSLEDNVKMFIDDVSMPHSWYTVEEDVNDKIYMDLHDTVLDVHSYLKVQVPSGNYTGATFTSTLKDTLNATTSGLDTDIFSTEYFVRENTFTMSVNYVKYTFRILTETELASNYNALWTSPPDPSYDSTNPQSINEILNNLADVSVLNTDASPYTSGYLNLQSIRNIYIHSPNLGAFSTIGPKMSDRTVLKKIPVTANYNEVFFDNIIAPMYDHVDVSNQTLRTLEFHIKDSRGNFVNFHGSHLSFSLIFARMNV